MIKHHLTKYSMNGKKYAESWIQLNILGMTWYFSKKTIEL